MSELRVGVIGCGFIASEAHLPAIGNTADLEIAAIADMSSQRLAAYGARASVRAPDRYTDYRRVLDRPDVDLVIVSVPPGAHCEVVTAAAGAGKHVICEKPIATTLGDAAAMLAASRDNRVKLAVFNNFLFFPETILVGEIVRSGAIGAVKVAWINAFGLGMDVANFLTYQGGTSRWKYDPGVAGGGVLMDYGPHAAYLMEHYVGQAAVRVNAVTGRLGESRLPVEDYVFCRLEFPSGYGMIQLAWHPAMQSAARALQTGSTAIVGETGLIEFVYRGRGEGPHTAVEKVVVRTAQEESVH